MGRIIRPANLLGQYLRPNVSTHKVGVVVSAGKMSKAVKVRIAAQEWNNHIRKYFPSPKTYLVADPNSSLHEGDVVRIASGYRSSKQIHHVVTAIVAPFGTPVSERPPVLTEEQLMAKRLEQRLEKDVRSKQRGRLTSIWRLKEARAAGYKVPDLESAIRKLKLHEEAEAERTTKSGGSGEAHKGQAGQELTAKERRRAEREKTGAERKAEERAKKAAQQVQGQGEKSGRRLKMAESS